MTDIGASEDLIAGGLVQGPNPSSQVVRLVNEGDTPWTDMYANQRYTIQPNQQTFVPFYAMCLWFGHPDAMDVPGDRRKAFRLEEYRRLQVRYGTYDDQQALEASRPKITCWTVDGAKIITVLEDPAGNHLNPAVQDANERDLLQRAMAQMQTQMDAMKAQMGAHQRADDAEVASGGEVRTDSKGASPEPLPHPTGGLVTDVPPPMPPQISNARVAPPSIPLPDVEVPRTGEVNDGMTLPEDLPDDDGMDLPETDIPNRPKVIS